MSPNRTKNGFTIHWLTSLAVLLCLLAPAAPAAGEGNLHQLAQERLEQVRERIENLTPEEKARLKAGRMSQKSVLGLGLKAIGEFACLPTCNEDDAKFLAIAGAGLVTLSDPVLDLSISVPEGTATFSLGVFDGDGGKPDPTSIDNPPGGNFSRWDLTGPFGFTSREVNYSYRLFAAAPGQPEVQST